MSNKFLLLIILCTAMMLSGCATNQMSKPACFIAGAAAGAGAGAIIEDEGGPMAAGAVVGGLIGYFICDRYKDSDGDGVIDSKDSCPNTPSGVAVNSIGCPLDSDGDGVTDDNDSCPNTPRGVQVGTNGCPLDSDGDGVTDDKDRCPNTPRGAAVNSEGCQPDSDGDGVYDSVDACPGTPAGQAVNEKGCHTIFSLEGVNFATDSAELTSAAEAELGRAIQALAENPGINIRVEGHTDSRGSESYNQSLSEKRAQTVFDYLVMKGVDRGRLSVKGYGENSPVADNATKEGRAQNRRVDLVVAD